MEKEKIIELVKKANNNDTKYVMYSLSGVTDTHDSRYHYVEKSHRLIERMVKEFSKLQSETGKRYLVENRFVKLNKSINDLLVNKEQNSKLNFNPSFESDSLSFSFCFYSENINDELFKKVFTKCAKTVTNDFNYKVSKQKYETNNYRKGNKQLWIKNAKQILLNAKVPTCFEICYKPDLELGQ